MADIWDYRDFNAGIVVTKDQSLCVVFDKPLPAPLKHMEFNAATFQFKMVFEDTEIPGFLLEYPLDYDMVPLLIESQTLFIARAEGDQVSEPVEVPVVFVNEEE